MKLRRLRGSDLKTSVNPRFYGRIEVDWKFLHKEL